MFIVRRQRASDGVAHVRAWMSRKSRRKANAARVAQMHKCEANLGQNRYTIAPCPFFRHEIAQGGEAFLDKDGGVVWREVSKFGEDRRAKTTASRLPLMRESDGGVERGAVGATTQGAQRTKRRHGRRVGVRHL